MSISEGWEYTGVFDHGGGGGGGKADITNLNVFYYDY
jgi:hypothetical protein